MSRVPWFDDNPRLWDQVTIHNNTFLGRLKGRQASRVDQKNKAGTDGATLTHLGRDPAEIDITLVLFRQEHLDAFAALMPVLQARANQKRPQAVDVVHPSLTLLGIRTLFYKGGGLVERATSRDPATVTLSFVEFLKPRGDDQTTRIKTNLVRSTVMDSQQQSQQQATPLEERLQQSRADAQASTFAESTAP